MRRNIFHHAFLSLLLLLTATTSGCGGGSSGTALGSSGENKSANFSGVVVTTNGSEVADAQITLLNTDDSVETNEAGTFELETNFPGGDATFAVTLPNGSSAEFTVTDIPSNPKEIELSVVFDPVLQQASLIDLTLRARIVGNCSPLFLNTRTIRQRAAVAEGRSCILEVEVKSEGFPVDGLLFKLEHRGCAKQDPWQFSAAGTTGTSGTGVSELAFNFKNDENHCVYRIRGPIELAGTVPLTAQLHTLRKQEFDRKRNE